MSSADADSGFADPTAWVREHSPWLLSRARLRLPSWHEAEEVVQDTLIAAWRDRELLRGPVRPWLQGILRRKIADRFREIFRERSALEREAGAFPAIFNEEDGHWAEAFRPKSGEASVPDTRAAGEARESLTGCLGKLPPATARLFVLREVEGYETEEICEMTGTNANALWVALHRARAALRSCLRESGYADR